VNNSDLNNNINSLGFVDSTQATGWLHAAVAGNVEAFGQLYRLHASQIYRYCAYRVANPTEAEDLTAEVFLKAWQAIGRYQIGAVPFSAWLYRIAHNQVVNHHQRFQRRTEAADADLDEFMVENITDPGEANDPLAYIIQNVKHEALRQALASLPEEPQQVLFFRFVEGWSHAQVAALLGKSEGTVRGIQYRALEALAKILDRGTFVGE
jgi:RNA polymerase sigma-70 factor (ECF subfamily)